MAAQKSKNPSKHTKSEAPKPKTLVGRKVRYLGNGNVNICPRCGAGQRKGMVSEYQGQLYCSEACVQAVAS